LFLAAIASAIFRFKNQVPALLEIRTISASLTETSQADQYSCAQFEIRTILISSFVASQPSASQPSNKNQ
jgi:hypothetical protein